METKGKLRGGKRENRGQFDGEGEEGEVEDRL